MSDQNEVSLFEHIQFIRPAGMVVPGYLHQRIRDSTNAKGLHSYAITEQLDSDVDAFVVHKDLMHKIDPRLLTHVYFHWSMSFANDVFCVYTRVPNPGSDRIALRDHSGPVTSFIGRAHEVRCRPISEPKSALIVSAFGVENVGDDLVTIASERMLRDIGIEAVKKAGPSPTLQDIQDYDLIALGGGGLLYDSCQENLENYLWPLRLARQLGKKTALLGVGTQGIRTASGRANTVRILRDVDFVSVRSQPDKDFLDQLDEASDLDVICGQDMAFYLADDLRSRALSFDHGQKVALLSVSIILNESLAKAGFEVAEVVANIVDELRKSGYRIKLALHSTDDVEFYCNLARRHDLEILDLSKLGIYGTATAYAGADLIVTSRFHALIYAAIFGKPVISLYESKTREKRTIYCKSGRLIHSYLMSIRAQSEDVGAFDLPRLVSKLSRAKAVDPGEVKRCEELAKAMRASLLEAIDGS